MLYEKMAEGKTRCYLCGHQCIINQGKRGLCGVRENRESILHTLVYGKIVAENIDPIEKNRFFIYILVLVPFPSPRRGVIFVVIFARITVFHKHRAKAGA